MCLITEVITAEGSGVTGETEKLGSVFVLESLFPPKNSVLSQPIEAGLALGERLQRTIEDGVSLFSFPSFFSLQSSVFSVKKQQQFHRWSLG